MIILGLIGYPLGHSLSPKIHQAALDSCGLEGQYHLYPVLPDQISKLKILLNRVRCGEIQGLNVTIPHKQTIIPLLDRLTPTAESIGAVNTILMQNGKLIGDNTDATGFLADLHNFFVREGWEGANNHHALVIGAGGAAKAITYALLNDGWKITLTARRPEQVQAIINQFPSHDSQVSNIEYQANAFYPLISSLHLIINATPVGMLPNIENSPWPTGLPFPQRAFIYDLVYNPRDTKFVLDARTAGLPAISGLGMLMEQATLAFKLWTGRAVSHELLFGTLAFD